MPSTFDRVVLWDEPDPVPGEVWLCTLDKDRPAIVLAPSRNRPARTGEVWLVPTTTQDKGYYGPRFALVAGEAGMGKRSWAKLEEICCVPRSRLVNLIGRLSANREKALLREILFQCPRLH